MWGEQGDEENTESSSTDSKLDETLTGHLPLLTAAESTESQAQPTGVGPIEHTGDQPRSVLSSSLSKTRRTKQKVSFAPRNFHLMQSIRDQFSTEVISDFPKLTPRKKSLQETLTSVRSLSSDDVYMKEHIRIDLEAWSKFGQAVLLQAVPEDSVNTVVMELQHAMSAFEQAASLSTVVSGTSRRPDTCEPRSAYDAPVPHSYSARQLSDQEVKSLLDKAVELTEKSDVADRVKESLGALLETIANSDSETLPSLYRTLDSKTKTAYDPIGPRRKSEPKRTAKDESGLEYRSATEGRLVASEEEEHRTETGRLEDEPPMLMSNMYGSKDFGGGSFGSSGYRDL